jgi:ligand-binding sensor domain-containing protein/signal transduction histidine kinase
MRKILTCLFIVLLSAIHAISQDRYDFRHYEVEDGLSNNNVLCILQDKKGFMWFGTRDGLNRFDGYSFKIFRKDPSNPKSLGNDHINCMLQDENELIWVGAQNGLYKFNPVDQSFEHIQVTAEKYVRSIYKDNHGVLWMTLNDTLTTYDPIKSTIRQYVQFRSTSVCSDQNGTLWVGTKDGFLKKFNRADHSFTSFDVFSKSPKPNSRWIEKIYDTKRGTLLIGTLAGGIKLFDIKTGDYKDIVIYNQDKTAMYAKNFMQYSENEYWAGTEIGIVIYDLAAEKSSILSMQYNNVYSLSDNAIHTLYKDKEGGVWVGTRFGGISYYPYPYTPFKKYYSQIGSSQTISGNGVHEIYPDKKGNLWIGTEDAGLNKMNISTGEVQHFLPDGKPGSISYSNIHGLLVNDNELWIGTYQYGIDIMDLRTGKVIKKYKAGKNSFPSNFIVHLYKTRKGDILAGTWEGLFKYNRNTDDFSQVPGFAFQTQNITEDKDGLLWICTLGNGVFTLDQRTGKIESFRNNPGDPNSLSHNWVNGQLIDSYGNLWFATEGGLCKYYPAKKIFKTYTTRNGLPSNFIFKILEDQRGNLWVTTTKGLVRFNPLSETANVYTTVNGLLSDQFNWNSAYKDSAGNMYFGSVKGMISFHPDKFTTNNITPPVYITGIQVYNEEIPIHVEESPLKKSIIYTDHLTLQHDQSTISIDFAALSFTSPEMNEYAYKMEGFDKEWTLLKSNRKAYFTELPPGHYTFKVKASNGSGVWNNKSAELEIEILPPFWASRWAYLLYAVTIVGVICLLIYNYHQRITNKNKRKLEQIEHKKEQELYKNKIEFFLNVAHEIRTPLTLIQGPMEDIMNYVDDFPGIKNNLRIMERNTNRLINIANQILDFRQTEVKEFSLYFEKINIAELLQDIHTSFKPLAEQHNLRYVIDMPVKELMIDADLDSIQKILGNMYSNAIKYASRKVYVKFIPNEEENKFGIEISNDGFIIPVELKEKIFEPFFRIQETSNQKGTGIGLAISKTLAELHDGKIELKEPNGIMNTFILELKIHNSKKLNKTSEHFIS